MKKPHNPGATAAVAIAAAAGFGTRPALDARAEKKYLRTLDIGSLDGKDLPWGRANGYQLDVS